MVVEQGDTLGEWQPRKVQRLGFCGWWCLEVVMSSSCMISCSSCTVILSRKLSCRRAVCVSACAFLQLTVPAKVLILVKAESAMTLPKSVLRHKPFQPLVCLLHLDSPGSALSCCSALLFVNLRQYTAVSVSFLLSQGLEATVRQICSRSFYLSPKAHQYFLK